MGDVVCGRVGAAEGVEAAGAAEFVVDGMVGGQGAAVELVDERGKGLGREACATDEGV